MKYVVIILAIVTGGFMLIDGIHVMIKGKYIGPPEPGPWASLFYKLKLDVFKLGPLFIAFALAWLTFLAGLLLHRSWSYPLGIIISILTLWYLPIGTLLSLLTLLVLLFSHSKPGI